MNGPGWRITPRSNAPQPLTNIGRPPRRWTLAHGAIVFPPPPSPRTNPNHIGRRGLPPATGGLRTTPAPSSDYRQPTGGFTCAVRRRGPPRARVSQPWVAARTGGVRGRLRWFHGPYRTPDRRPGRWATSATMAVAIGQPYRPAAPSFISGKGLCTRARRASCRGCPAHGVAVSANGTAVNKPHRSCLRPKQSDPISTGIDPISWSAP